MICCHGCDATIPDPHPNRKWCSERCRKGSYGQPCVDCGARTCYGAETGRVPEPRCQDCAVIKRRNTRTPRQKAIIEMWAAGFTVSQIAAGLDITGNSVTSEVWRIRQHSPVLLPYRRSAAEIARIREGYTRWAA